MAPVILALRETGRAKAATLFSGQHKDMVHPVLEWFGIGIDDAIHYRAEDRSLAELTSWLFKELELAFVRNQPDIVLAQGDTTTAMVAAVVSFYGGIPFGHVEAGLRTGDLRAPFPEEFNRVATGKIANWHFCPTQGARTNLLEEGVNGNRIFITGNTVIDALALTTTKLAQARVTADDSVRHVLLTVHRRENFGERMLSICNAVKRLRDAHANVVFTVPVHPNPQVQTAVKAMLGGEDRIQLMAHLPYPDLVQQMMRSFLIITDSGGIQEEAPFLKKPVLVLRDVTERPEAVELGLARLIGTEENSILRNATELLSNEVVYRRMARGASPYGDGQAAQRICAALGLASLRPAVAPAWPAEPVDGVQPAKR